MSDTPPSPPQFAWDWVGAWTCVFAANLPMPLLFGVGMVGSGRLIGLSVAVAMLYLMGAVMCGLRWRVGRSLCWGGGVVAVSQGLPLLHILAGLFAIALWNNLTGYSTFFGQGATGSSGWELVQENFAVCVVVFLTAQPLLGLSLIIGVWIRICRRDTPIWFTNRTDPDELPQSSRVLQNPFADDEGLRTRFHDEPDQAEH